MQANVIEVPWKTQHIVPVGDIQLGAMGVSMDTLKKDIERGLDNDAWFLGMGDYVDSMSPSGRQKYKTAGFYDSTITALNKDGDKQIEELMEVLEPTIGRWLGLHEGHHFHDFGDGSTTDTRLCQILKAPFLGSSALTRVKFMNKGAGRSRRSLVIYSTHGTGSGATQSAPLNKLEKLSGGIEADIYLINHYARKGAIPADRIYMDARNHINHTTKWYVATGGYMGAYTEGSSLEGRAQGSYVEKAMMTPTTLGGVLIRVEPQRWTENKMHYTNLETTVTL